MKKYVIKNCPKLANTNRRIGTIFDTCDGIDYDTDEFEYCKDISDCLIKRIVELCNRNIDRVYYLDGKKIMQGQKLAVDILEQLEIEEVDE